MPNCCVIGCKSRGFSTLKGSEQVEYEKSHGKISFHRFPKNIQLRKLWLDRIGELCLDITTYSCVCSLHFNDCDLDRTSLSYIRLRENALPKISSTDTTGSFDHDYTRKQSLQEMKKDSFITNINKGYEKPLAKHRKKNLESKISSTDATGSFDYEYTRKQSLQEMKKDSFIKDTNKGHEEPLAKHRKKNLEHSNIFEEKFEDIETPSKEECLATTPKRAKYICVINVVRKYSSKSFPKDRFRKYKKSIQT